MNQNKSDNDFLARLAHIFGVVGKFLGNLALKGAMRRDTWEWKRLQHWMVYAVAIFALVYAPKHSLPYWIDRFSWAFPKGLGVWTYFHVSRSLEMFLLLVLPFVAWLVLRGSAKGFETIRFQRGLDHLGLKTSTDFRPVVVEAVSIGEHQKKLTIMAVGIDISEFQNRKGALESGFGAIIEEIRVSARNRQFVEILLAEKALPSLVRYDREAIKHLVRPYSFLVGQSLSEFITGNLAEIHHMIIAGGTGGGKSFFFKQTLVGLAESSKNIQFYLIDLKYGVETKLFGSLGNVKIAKEAPEAIAILTAVVAEMEDRFRFLEKNGFTEIVPERDKKDRLVVAIDEASVLFTIEKSSKSTRASAESARDLADRIAKLGRAAGIHLILATQKVVKETIDTRVQTNIDARMVFRVNTVPSSMTVLGNKMAAELPKIGGRGIWSVGSQEVIVQVPRLTLEEVEERIENLVPKFDSESKGYFGPMLEVTRPELTKKVAFTRVMPKKIQRKEGLDTSES